jgi:hypothetical protein
MTRSGMAKALYRLSGTGRVFGKRLGQKMPYPEGYGHQSHKKIDDPNYHQSENESFFLVHQNLNNRIPQLAVL